MKFLPLPLRLLFLFLPPILLVLLTFTPPTFFSAPLLRRSLVGRSLPRRPLPRSPSSPVGSSHRPVRRIVDASLVLNVSPMLVDASRPLRRRPDASSMRPSLILAASPMLVDASRPSDAGPTHRRCIDRSQGAADAGRCIAPLRRMPDASSMHRSISKRRRCWSEAVDRDAEA